MFMQWSAPLNPQNCGVAGSANGGAGSSSALNEISATPSYTLPANFSQLAGATVFRLTARGVFSNTGTPTLLLGFYYGNVAGTALATTGATTTASGVTNLQWYMDALVVIRTLGTSGTAWTQGEWGLGTSATAMSHLPLPGAAPAAVTVDTTAAKVISVGGQWGTANASNLVTCHQFLIEAVA
jgi:hypothetical protein